MSMSRNSGLVADPLFVGATRPAMRWGVTYIALLVNAMVSMELFLMTRNLLTLLMCVPVHGICALLCARDPRCFDLLLLWGRTRLPAALSTLGYWQASSFSPLVLRSTGRRGRQEPTVVLGQLEVAAA